jgi:hypothetical protein
MELYQEQLLRGGLRSQFFANFSGQNGTASIAGLNGYQIVIRITGGSGNFTGITRWMVDITSFSYVLSRLGGGS